MQVFKLPFNCLADFKPLVLNQFFFGFPGSASLKAFKHAPQLFTVQAGHHATITNTIYTQIYHSYASDKSGKVHEVYPLHMENLHSSFCFLSLNSDEAIPQKSPLHFT